MGKIVQRAGNKVLYKLKGNENIFQTWIVTNDTAVCWHKVRVHVPTRHCHGPWTRAVVRKNVTDAMSMKTYD